MVLPLPLFLLFISLQMFPVPVVRMVTADNPDTKVFIKKANTRKFIFNRSYEFDLTFRRKGISLVHMFSFY